MQIIILLVGMFSLVYGFISYKKEVIVIPKHEKLFSNWWKEPYWVLKGKKAKNASLVFILLGLVIFINLFIINSGLVSYP